MPPSCMENKLCNDYVGKFCDYAKQGPNTCTCFLILISIHQQYSLLGCTTFLKPDRDWRYKILIYDMRAGAANSAGNPAVSSQEGINLRAERRLLHGTCSQDDALLRKHLRVVRRGLSVLIWYGPRLSRWCVTI